MPRRRRRRSTRLHRGGLHRRAEAGREAAGEQRRALERRLGLTFASAISGITVYSAKVEVPMKWRIGSPPRERRVVPEVALALLLPDRQAEVRARRAAVDAVAALRREEGDDVVAGRDGIDAVADALDDAGALVTEHGRRVAGGRRPRRCRGRCGRPRRRRGGRAPRPPSAPRARAPAPRAARRTPPARRRGSSSGRSPRRSPGRGAVLSQGGCRREPAAAERDRLAVRQLILGKPSASTSWNGPVIR